MDNNAQIIGEDFFTIKDLKEKWKVAEYVEFCHTGNPLKLVKYTDEIEKYQPFMLSFFFAHLLSIKSMIMCFEEISRPGQSPNV